MNYNNLVTILNTTFSPPRKIKFYGAVPDEFSENHSAEFEDITIKGRSAPLAIYSGSSAENFDVTIEIHEDFIRQFGGGSSASIEDVVNELKALTYPRYAGGLVIAPRCHITIGDFFRRNVYVTSRNITWKKPLRKGEDGRMRYISASVTLGMTEIRSESLSADQFFL